MINKLGLMQYKETEDKLDKLKSNLKDKKKLFEEENKSLIEEIKTISEKQDELKLNFKAEALMEYTETGLKKCTGGLGIRVGSILEYDAKQALEWSKNHNLCLKLDVRAFEKIAKSQDIDFVKQIERVSATFPSVLTFNPKEE